jgi:hypothetical protein
MHPWQTEVEELHEVFETYFRGTTDSLDRVDLALATDFTILGPSGGESSRAGTMQALAAAHGRAPNLQIRTSDYRFLFEQEGMLVASYIERQAQVEADSESDVTRRLSTAIFTADDDAPNGLIWRRVHETWMA